MAWGVTLTWVKSHMNMECLSLSFLLSSEVILTHIPRGRIMLERFRKHPFPSKSHSSLQQAELGSPLVCAVGWKGSPANSIGWCRSRLRQCSPDFEGYSTYDLLLYFSFPITPFSMGQRIVSSEKWMCPKPTVNPKGYGRLSFDCC